MSWKPRSVILVLLNSRRYDIFKVFAHTVVISRKTVKWAGNTICDTCGLNSWRYGIFEVLAHTVVISRKTVKWAENTISDPCALNSRRYGIFEVLPHKAVLSRKTLKWAQNSICDTFALNSWRYEIFEVSAHTVVISLKTVQMSWEHDLWYLCFELTEIWDFWSFKLKIVIRRQKIKWSEKKICDTCALNSRKFEISEVLPHTVVIIRKTVKWAQKNDLWYLCTELTEMRFLMF